MKDIRVVGKVFLNQTQEESEKIQKALQKLGHYFSSSSKGVRETYSPGYISVRYSGMVYGDMSIFDGNNIDLEIMDIKDLFLLAEEQEEPLTTSEVIKKFMGDGLVGSPVIYGSKRVLEIEKESKHSHYFKDVSDLDSIDVYRVIDLWNVTDPCIQHALKKMLVAGGRGAGKDIAQDIQEAIDSLERWKEMREEEK